MAGRNKMVFDADVTCSMQPMFCAVPFHDEAGGHVPCSFKKDYDLLVTTPMIMSAAASNPVDEASRQR